MFLTHYLHNRVRYLAEEFRTSHSRYIWLSLNDTWGVASARLIYTYVDMQPVLRRKATGACTSRVISSLQLHCILAREAHTSTTSTTSGQQYIPVMRG